MTAYVEAGLEQIPVQFERAVAAVEHGFTEDPPGLIAAAILLALPGMYFETVLAWLPMELFLFAVQVTNERRLVAFPRLGAVLAVLGLCVGTVFDRNLGFTLLRYGKLPFHAAIARFCSDHARLISGLALLLIVAEAVLKVPAVSMLAIEVVGYLLPCLVLYFLTRMMA